MWRTLATYGVSGRLLRAVKALYENSKARVRVEDELTECFEVQQGVRQGCLLYIPIAIQCLFGHDDPRSKGSV